MLLVMLSTPYVRYLMCLVEVLQAGCDMEGPLPCKYPTASRCYHDRESVRDGIGVDEEWEHQPVFGGECRCESIGTCVSSLKVFIFACH